MKQSNRSNKMKSSKKGDPVDIEIRKAFLTSSKSTVDDKLKLIKEYIENEPKYLNELKLFLKEHDKDLYRKYADCFKSNSGYSVAFGMETDSLECSEINRDTKRDVIRVDSLKPVFHTTRTKKDDLKKKIACKNKKEVREKFRNKQEKKKEYEAKLSKIHEKIKKSN